MNERKTRHRVWPTSAADARDTTAELAQNGEKLAKELIEKQLNDVEKVKHYFWIFEKFSKIRRIMEFFGAKTRP
jgi:predicted transcriptional regulator